MSEKVASQFVLQAIQEWGQPPERRIAAVQAVLDAAGFRAKSTCWPIFGAIWPEECTGQEAEQATVWLHKLTDSLPRGHFEDEVDHVLRAIQERQGTRREAKKGIKT